LTNNRANAKPN